ncbi:hypothetical protein PILCRDRAFT_508936 [Piloderma croceum F 1598]|uniref:Uncharacterized protein n=1 Tax=Piloderma croceum (strain F 1598) TaxID=765440 RepID=A0A0C3FP21_PILCF|nr:hypothetical protein PILCRDRAFT_508936 [Piloderma croceum F 1598]
MLYIGQLTGRLISSMTSSWVIFVEQRRMLIQTPLVLENSIRYKEVGILSKEMTSLKIKANILGRRLAVPPAYDLPIISNLSAAGHEE